MGESSQSRNGFLFVSNFCSSTLLHDICAPRDHFMSWPLLSYNNRKRPMTEALSSRQSPFIFPVIIDCIIWFDLIFFCLGSGWLDSVSELNRVSCQKVFLLSLYRCSWSAVLSLVQDPPRLYEALWDSCRRQRTFCRKLPAINRDRKDVEDENWQRPVVTHRIDD